MEFNQQTPSGKPAELEHSLGIAVNRMLKLYLWSSIGAKLVVTTMPAIGLVSPAEIVAFLAPWKISITSLQ